MTKSQKLVLVLVIVLAVFFRFYRIAEMPGGLFPDEAANGLDINLMQQGQLQPFYERGNGREALFFYMLWGSVELFGKGPWQHHIVSATVGVLAVLLCFLFTRRLFAMDDVPLKAAFKGTEGNLQGRGVNIALLAAFLMAVSSWHTVLSRTAFRANLIPLFATLTLYLLLVTYQSATLKRKLLFAFLTGASFALGFYTYIAYRILVPILFMVILWPFLATIKNRQFTQAARQWLAPALMFAAAFALFIYPLFHYFTTHPGSFIGRSGQVSIFNQTLYTINGQELQNEPTIPQVLNVLGEVTKRSLLGFFTAGDLNWRHNISGHPFLSQLVSPFFGVGLVLAFLMAVGYMFMPNRKKTWWKYFLLTGWFWGMLLPVVTTAEGIPHGLRSVGIIPTVFILGAWIIYSLAEIVLRYHRAIYERWHGIESWQYRFTTKLLKLIPAAFAIALVSQTYFAYFVYAYNDPANFYAFRSDLTPVSEYLKKRCNKEYTYLVLDKFSVQTTDYLTSDWHGNFNDECSVPYKQVDPENASELTGLKPGDEIVFTQSSIFDIKKFKEHHPEAKLRVEIRNKFGEAVMAVYRVY